MAVTSGVNTNKLTATGTKSSSGTNILIPADQDYLLIDATDFLLINASGDKLLIR